MNLLDVESEKIKTIDVQGEKYLIHCITPLDRVKITQHRMRLQAGNPVESLTQDDFTYFENIAIVDTCVDEYPARVKTHESCVNWVNQSLINEIAFKVREHTADFEQKLKKNKPVERGIES